MAKGDTPVRGSNGAGSCVHFGLCSRASGRQLAVRSGGRRETSRQRLVCALASSPLPTSSNRECLHQPLISESCKVARNTPQPAALTLTRNSALQGSFSEHIAILQTLPFPLDVTPIRTSAQLAQVSALIIPGGESTAISLLASSSGLLADLREFVQLAKDGKRSVWGTCAGMILLGEEVVGSKAGYEGLGGVDMRVVRNQWGRQVRDLSPADLRQLTLLARLVRVL